MAPKIKRTSYYELTARDFLENIGREIKSKRKNYSIHSDKLKGNISSARFSDGLFRWWRTVNKGPPDSCSVDHRFHTNINDSTKDGRDPCDGRKKERFGEDEGFECGSRIRDYNKKDSGTACVPPRRRHICDKNLEFLNNENTENTDDLLGNVLVTAKYEGDCIVDHLPDNEKSNMCTIFARTFADIGDIVRGRDMFKPNDADKVEKGLQVVFKKIYEGLKNKGANVHYKEDKDENYYKLRNDWWNVNRDQVWRALTCVAGEGNTYFIQLDDSKRLFWDRKCGHSNEGAPPTNLDYVPQYLRWFEEWAEEFCRINKIKIDKVKKECRDEQNKKYCSGDGHDCTQTNLSHNQIFVDLDCPRCQDQCIKYNEWIVKKLEEFYKQNLKYSMEIQKWKKTKNNYYDKEFYENLDKKSYSTIDKFLNLLNNGKHCHDNKDEKNKIDFNKPIKTFSISEYCKTCPLYGVTCTNRGICIHNSNNKNKGENDLNKINIKDKSPTTFDVDMIYLRRQYMKNELKSFVESTCLFKGMRNQEWTCQILKNLDVCKLNNFNKVIDIDKHITFKVLLERWLKDFLEGYKKSKRKINPCTKDKNSCIKLCINKCTCVEEWLNKKEKEWGQIKKHFNKQFHGEGYDIAFKVKSYFEDNESDVRKSIDNFHVLKNKEEYEICNVDDNCRSQNNKKKKDIVTILLKELKDKIVSCKNQHKATKGKECCDKLPKIADGDTSDDEEQEDEAPAPPKPKPPSTPNPCVRKDQSGTHIVSVEDVAEWMQGVTHDRVKDVDGLKADASKGTYSRMGSPSAFNDICNIEIKHSNAVHRSGYNYKGPCTGKNQERFKIGTDWKDANFVSTIHKDFYLPPRREHMCTSNLEKLDVQRVIGYSNVNDSFLGDVLVAAKFEGENIKERLKKYPADQTICRSMRYSFADIGDIIRGKDLWDKDNGAKDMEKHLVSIFKKIKEKHYGIKDNPKYEKGGEPFTKLRSDWWSANRDQIWKAMQCQTLGPRVINTCDKEPTPIDDYIPQRLRWMTEWAEWFCKAQNKYYGDLVGACRKCQEKKTECTQGTSQCDTCKEKCTKYNDFIKKWQPQWKQMEQKYKDLYGKAKIAANGDETVVPNGHTTDKDQQVVNFLKLLIPRSDKSGSKSGNTPYSTAGGYIHETADVNNCNTQKVFCNTTSKDNYAFQLTPKGYEQECMCEKRPKAPQKKPEVPKVKPPTSACDIVKNLLDGKGETSSIYGCNIKSDVNWECEKNIDPKYTGACMPPRRQKLCVSSLTKQRNIKEKEDIRTEFIKSAAIETHFAWYKYKKDNDKAERELNSGIIPEGFIRQMYYTFGDYRDIFFGTDISKHSHISRVSSSVKDILKKESKERKNPEEWWNEHGKEIWKAMLCALPGTGNLQNNPDYNNPPEDVAKKPQFLRWFTEWGEDFCRTRGVKIKELEKGCAGYECDVTDETKKEACKKACEKYQTWLKDWKTQYEKQSQKFTRDKGKPEYEVDPDVASSQNAYKYLSKKLKSICQNGSTTEKCDYNCMENASRQPQTSASSDQQENSSTQKDLPEAFDCPPKEIGDRCNCPKLPEPKYCVDKTAHDIRKENGKNFDINLKGNVNTYNDNCKNAKREDYANQNGETCKFKEVSWSSIGIINNENESTGRDRFKIGEVWECNKETTDGKNKVCVPPRRKDMCLKKLQDIRVDDISDSSTLLKEIQEVAKNEGNDIIRNLLPKYPCNEDVICKYMKYSFADLGDIVRGTDKYKDVIGSISSGNNSEQIEENLKTIFENIQKTDENFQKKYTNLELFRSAWWDANRKDIWKAMTCNAPDEAKIYITKEGGYISPLTWTKNHCGHNDDPPDYDYIPQPLRWISEWSESYCLAQKDFLETMKNCENCKKKNDNTDCEQTKYGACRDCKKKCEEYKKFVDKWKAQFETQNKAYKEIYKNATTSSGRHSNGIDEDIKKFVEKLEQNCQKNSVDTADKYLEGGSVCRRFKFVKTDTHEKNYAFHNTPLSYKEHCECAKNFDPLDECPVDNNECKKYGIGSCPKKNFHKKLEEWTNYVLNNKSNKNKSAIVPPRRRQLCLQNLTRNLSRLNKEKSFKEGILISAASEAKMLTEQYRENPAKALQAIKYSFADIGNIIKGDDIIGNVISVQLNKLINGNKKINTSTLWWEANKEKIWNAMMCYYTGDEKTATSCPSHDNIDKEDQFLRWFQEWGENFCATRKELYEKLNNECKSVECNASNGNVNELKCTKACEEYKSYVLKKKTEYEIQKDKYDKEFNKTLNNKNALEFLNVQCISEYFSDSKNWESPYDTFDDDTLKGTCDCKKHEPKTPAIKPSKPASPEDKKLVPDSPLIPIQPQPSNNTSDILATTIPFGIALALGSIAFLFLKKKPKSPVDLLRVLDVHKGDYGTPTPKSSNRYIPYASDRHKGKTYIYMEGDSSGDEKYAFMSDTTDVTSSESEYEEMDINDIYVPGSPKYKTLIEVVLEPSKSNGNTPSKGDDTPRAMTPLTDEEWSELKHDFISQYVQRESMGVPQYDVLTDLPMNIVGNVLDDGINEKPFITSIHDRDLYTGEEISYNIHMSTNSMDDPKYVSNNVYSGIDLINDTLSGNQHIDIYDEVLKRKENELFGTNYKKNTSNNSVAKLTNSDPIMNQLDLLHKWLDRHRDMCNTWNTKEELLDKLNEEWNKDNDGGDIPNDNRSLNTDVSIQIDMDDGKPKKEFSNMDTILDDMEDDIYYDVNDDENPSVDDIPMDHNRVEVPKKVHVEMKILNNTSNGSLEPEFPISDVWNI
ncbi:hypothetical protein PFUGPA_05931 [Plasmodium falciparum Palo Alto/Uganda]|uniref:Erythrocyte membrane protein 1 n=1 Tax=Plasmodium falciparum (isolate Palo Alto / Uganda) TaxID=57270 RepID=W4IQR8_PLAFP|nr:hypothetical protein PFUGPA_05931 [Plasmodium falciparum Palo Alto/Uganda]